MISPLLNLVRRRIAAKLTLTYLFLVSAIILVMGISVTRTLEQRSVLNLKANLAAQGMLVKDTITPSLIRETPQALIQELAHEFGGRMGMRVTIIARDGVVLGDSEQTLEGVRQMENHRGRPEVKAALAGEIGSALRWSTTLQVDMLYVAMPLLQGEEVIGVLRLAVPLTEVKKAKASVRRAVLVGALIALGVAFAMSLLIARRVTRPVVEMERIAYRYASRDFGQRAPTGSQDEIGELGRALNAMAERLEEKIGDLERERMKVAAMLESMEEGVIAVDPQGQIVLMNRSARAILRLRAGQGEGRPFLEVIRNKDLFDLLQECRTCQQGEACRKEITLAAPLERILQAHATPLSLQERMFGTLLVLRDITELRRLERVRTEFVANVSHELRTPLTSIKGYLETLLGGALEEPENARRFLEIVFKHTERLSRLLDDLLELSNIELGKMKLELEPTELHEVMEGVLAILKPQAEAKGLTVTNEIPTGLPPVLADRDRLAQILINLVDNAVKFTPEGERVTVRAKGVGEPLSGLPEDPDSGRPQRAAPTSFLEISVTDTGIGIPSWDLPRITERFFRVEKARSRELGGTGLGLAIVKHLVQAHGGELKIESELGKGTQVTFTLPRA
ncbi:MAG: HAMP domain-containing protein [candidate division NC10 bacterium]|nr:HAMP domain-containing protein [candidate division NC10 bacterium]